MDISELTTTYSQHLTLTYLLEATASLWKHTHIQEKCSHLRLESMLSEKAQLLHKTYATQSLENL
jgi:hypothetical protein